MASKPGITVASASCADGEREHKTLLRFFCVFELNIAPSILWSCELTCSGAGFRLRRASQNLRWYEHTALTAGN
jgi:hypothetical protein